MQFNYRIVSCTGTLNSHYCALRLPVSIFCILMLFPVLLLADSLTLRDTLHRVVENHPGISLKTYQTKLAYQQQQAFASSADWQVRSSLGYAKIDYSGIPESLRGSLERTDRTAGLTVTKTFWSFGGGLILRHSVFKYSSIIKPIANISGYIPLTEYYTNNDAIFYIPLLRNFGGVQTRHGFEDWGYETFIRSLQQHEQIESLLAEIGHDYLDWALAVQNEELAKDYETELQKIKQSPVLTAAGANSTATRSGYLLDWSLAEASRVKASADALSVAAGSRLVEYTKIDKALLSSPNIVLTSTDKLTEAMRPGSVVLEGLRDLRVLNETEARLNYAINADENGAKPDLQLILTKSYSASDEHYSSAQDDDRTRFSVGLTFHYPFGNTAANARLNASKLRKMQNTDVTREHKLQLQAEITSRHALLTELKSALQKSKQEIAAAGQALTLDRAAFDAGKLDISLYLTAIQDAYRQKQAYLEDAARFQHELLDYLALIDRLWDGQTLGDAI